MTTTAHADFLKSLSDARERVALLKDYISHMDRGLEDDIFAVECDIMRGGGGGAFLDLASDPFPRLLHTGNLIAIMIFFERQMQSLAQSVKRSENLRLSLADLNGCVAERFRKYWSGVADLPFDVSEEEWQDVRGVLEVRNCLVHNDGYLSGFREEAIVRSFIRRHGRPTLEEDRMWVDKDMSLLALGIVEHFTDSIHKSALARCGEG